MRRTENNVRRQYEYNIRSAERKGNYVGFLEAATIFCFGLSWPISIRKSIVSRTAKGKSLFFELFLLLGYACGIARKIMQTVDGSSGFLFFLSFFFYILNFVEISIDVALYFRNKNWMNWPKSSKLMRLAT